MAKNRRPEAEQQPDSSSEGEEEDEEGSSSEESEEQQDTTSTPVSKKPPAPKKPEPTPQSSDDDDDEESESESESDSPPNTTRRPDPNIKPITSKPMEDTPKSTKKSRSEPTSATPASKPGAASKRTAAESENNGVDRDSKRAKKKKKDVGLVNDETTPKKNGESSRQLFQRLWSEDDVIVILKGLIEYREKKGADPMADLNAFQDFIKKSLHMGDVSKSQFSTKVRRLKKKYENNVKRAKNGQDRSFSNPYEQRAYDLSKKIWGSEVNNGVEVENGKGSTGKGKKNQKVLPNVDELGSPDGVTEGTRGEVELNTTAKRALRFDVSIGGSSLEAILEGGLELMDGVTKLELEEKWRQFRVEEVELHLKRLDLLREQSKLLLETLKSKRH